MLPTAEGFIDRARTSAGLTDLGADGWREGLERLIDAAARDLTLDPATAARLERSVEHRLTSRLRIEDWYSRQAAPPPPLDGIVIVHGLPRTATTALQYLLAKGPEFRYQRRWEITNPVPPPGATSDEDDERRLASIRKGQSVPGGSVQHITELDGPVDDNAILGLDFHNQELGLPLPTYTRWWRTASLKSTYAYHERVLRLLHANRPPRRWLVKAPYHNFHLDDLAAQYPGARFIMAHRDPAAAVPSACSTVATAQRQALPGAPPDPMALGAFLLEHLVEGIGRAMSARAVIGEDRFLDVYQEEVESDAVKTAERIYGFLGLDLDPAARTAMAAWAEANRRGSRGQHTYAAEDYGLTRQQIRAAFREYTERYGVAPEDE
jgi:Sulfotransferase family